MQHCISEKNKQVRNRLLLDKVDNENKIVELNHLVNKYRNDHLEDFTTLEKMRKEVDSLQEKHNKKVEQFKKNIGLSQEDLDNLMVSIYNRWQDEILSTNKNEDSKK